MSTPYRTPECGYTTVSSGKLSELDEAEYKIEQEREKEIVKAKEILTQIEKDYLTERVISDGQEKKRKRLKEKYSTIAKELYETNWMYPSIDDILRGGKSRR